jgi:predicted CoA-substrate-specific enzyme activase
MYRLGIDIGSVSVKAALLDQNDQVVWHAYLRHQGQPFARLAELLVPVRELIARAAVSVTGSGGRTLAPYASLPLCNEVIAQTRAIALLEPTVRSIIEVGGNDSKLIILGDKGGVADFAMNTMCAAGTGSFLDQQATRMNLSIEQFSETALGSTSPARIAGRCSVFAKSDMIHHQQEGTSESDIIAGLCRAMARNFRATVVKGHDLPRKVAFAGGVAANQGMVAAFREVLAIPEADFIVPELHKESGAVGAALSLDASATVQDIAGLIARLDEMVHSAINPATPLAPLTLTDLSRKHFSVPISSIPTGEGKTPVWLGIDVGSISTNVVAIDAEGKVLARRYLATAGKPIDAVRRGLSEVGAELSDCAEVKGVGATGSGRYMIGDLVGADVVRNEITAQARASIFFDPTVDTIFEIGGQDSKFISLENGVVVDFEMNKVCAAGTGSFLEEQAERLGINIVEEFGSLALSAASPVALGEKCTVFMDADLTHHQSHGSRRDDLVAGLAYSIVQNYLNRVVMGKKIGRNIFFQGGVAANRGVVAAFEKVLGTSVTVPPHHDVTGAIGIALMAKEELGTKPTIWKGFGVATQPYVQETMECDACPNQCEIRKVILEGEEPLFYGSRCEKYERKRMTVPSGMRDLFAQREKMLWAGYDANANPSGPIVALPRALTFYEMLPFWTTLLQELGARMLPTPATNRKIIDAGVAAAVSESCFPSKVALGHILEAKKAGADFILIPAIISLPRFHEHIDKSFACPYVETLPWVAEASLGLEKDGIKVLAPRLEFRRSRELLEKELWCNLAKPLGMTRSRLKSALDKAMVAYAQFTQDLQDAGKEALASLPRDAKAIVLVSRPYNGCDPEVSLRLATRVQEQGVMAIPIDMLPLGRIALGEEWDNMYWRYGQKLLEAAEIVADDPRLFAVYITNFGCGPDSYITHFFRRRLAGKPYLQLEIDEHSAGAGAITRLEAFLDSIANAQAEAGEFRRIIKNRLGEDKKRRIHVPYMCDQALILAAAFEACGVDATVMPFPDAQSLASGRKYTSGRECFPGIITTGDMVKIATAPGFDPAREAFFMPAGSGPCRFGQYNMLHRIVLADLGLGDVPIYSPNQGKSMYEDLGMVGNHFELLAWRGFVAADLLEKALLYIRPREKHPGATNEIYQRGLDRVCRSIKGEGKLEDVLSEIGREFAAVPLVPAKNPPTIGIVGEIYVRTNAFSNNDLIAKLEGLGAAVRVPPITEWFLYTNHTRKLNSLIDREYKRWLVATIVGRVQGGHERKLARIFGLDIPHMHEKTIKAVLKDAARYLDPIYEGEAILTVGKVLDFYGAGCAGVVNIMPLGCMPGNIVMSVLKRVREELGDFPILTMMYEGMEDTHDLARLEAFVWQAKEQGKLGGKP